MADYDTYGSSTHTAGDLVRLVSARLGTTFRERESHFRGIYYLADDHSVRVEVQPNEVPGDDEDVPFDDAHPEYRILVLTTTTTPGTTLRARLESIEGLLHLRHESV
ncbi:predicted protein [Streptomyces viridochromogenes DSM 40736]|uniref:Predicted protein n=1 Tax=Streptomyces viridochromogenes (strain DSM 40736 / JCM 4977 / BCRC 1201 / Tue 494) TaxID=591159 RepID=D9XAQ6_STRVT|nr:hypothetical protein [Streptomyces viridochromogenes]EFL32218.1 predicted protein [Streptomyces viridochromogenes DSM 40736]